MGNSHTPPCFVSDFSGPPTILVPPPIFDYRTEIFVILWLKGQLSSFGDISCRDFCLFSIIMGLNGALNTAPKVHLKKLNIIVSFQKS